MKKISSCISWVAKDHLTMTSRWQEVSFFRIYGRELVSKPAISLKKNWGGYRRTTLEREPGNAANSLWAQVVVVVLTLTRIIKSVVTGQAPVTLELRNNPGKTHTQPKGGTRIYHS